MNTVKNEKPKLSTQPYKGARDFYPEDMRVRNWLFGIWRDTAKKFGYEEYDFPILEPLELYAAKSGEELVNKQLYSFEDRGGRKITIRPEKTPSAARMVAAKINELPRPIRWFNIGNCWRYEKPQKGRGREFYQFDCDILGEESILADAEVFSIPVEVMRSLGATSKMFEIRVGNRQFTEYFLREIVKLKGGIALRDTQMYKVAKAIDVMPKIKPDEFITMLTDAGLSKDQRKNIQRFVNADLQLVEEYKEKSTGAKDLLALFSQLKRQGYKEYFVFNPTIMRGFDYYTGNVIEQFDLCPENTRAMFGGGRYDNLVDLFDTEPLTGVGLAMGDMTLLEFIKNWNLLPTFPPETRVYVTLFDEQYREITDEIIQKLREKGINTAVALKSEKIDKQLKYADRKRFPYAIILGPEEIKQDKLILKDLNKRSQKTLTLNEAIEILK